MTDTLQAALEKIIAQSPPDNWAHYDYLSGHCGYGRYGDPNYVDEVDESNMDDVHAHGRAVGRWEVARALRAALGAPGSAPSPSPDASLREFFYCCWDYARGLGGELDGADIQEWGEKLGLLQKVVASAPCGEGCVCADYVGDDFPTDCYRPTFERGASSPAPSPEPTTS